MKTSQSPSDVPSKQDKPASNLPIKQPPALQPGEKPEPEPKAAKLKKRPKKTARKTTIWIDPMPFVQSLWPDRTVLLHSGGALFRYDTIKARLKRAAEANQTVVVRNSQGSGGVPTPYRQAILSYTG